MVFFPFHSPSGRNISMTRGWYVLSKEFGNIFSLGVVIKVPVTTKRKKSRIISVIKEGLRKDHRGHVVNTSLPNPRKAHTEVLRDIDEK